MKLMILTLAGALASTVAFAQEATSPAPAAQATSETAAVSEAPAMEAARPDAFNNMEDLVYKGEIAGLQAWTTPRNNLLWMFDPKTGVIQVGFAFGTDGMSLHPDMKEQGMTVASLISGIYAPAQPDGIQVPKEFEDDILKALENLTEEGRVLALRQLTELLATVKTEAEYQVAIETWIANIDAAVKTAAADAPTPAEGQMAAEVPSTPDTPEAAETPNAEATEAAATPEAEAPTFIEALKTSYSLNIGPDGKPTVYALIDPSNEASKLLVRTLSGKAEAGDIQLRIVMIAAGSGDSFGVISGILTSEDPVKTLIAASAETDPADPFARVSELSEELQTAIRKNGDLVVQYGVPSAPFVAVVTDKGDVFIEGVPSDEQIAGALPM